MCPLNRSGHLTPFPQRCLVPLSHPAWSELQRQHDELKSVQMRTLFAEDPDRFAKFSRSFNDDEILLDFSKNLIADKTFRTLLNLAEQVRPCTWDGAREWASVYGVCDTATHRQIRRWWG